jgi:hypothetical protein
VHRGGEGCAGTAATATLVLVTVRDPAQPFDLVAHVASLPRCKTPMPKAYRDAFENARREIQARTRVHDPAASQLLERSKSRP